MIPTVFLIAALGTVLFPHQSARVVAITSVAWGAVVVVDDPAMPISEFLGSLALGTANAAIAVASVWIVRRVTTTTKTVWSSNP